MVRPARVELLPGMHPVDFDIEIFRKELFQSCVKKLPKGARFCGKCRSQLRSGNLKEFCDPCVNVALRRVIDNPKLIRSDLPLQGRAILLLEKEHRHHGKN